MELLTEPAVWLSLITLTAMEIVLGIDNVIFISILTDKLPHGQQPLARRLGLSLALILRLALLFAITWVMGLTAPLITLVGKGFSGRDLILLGGGLFLIVKATREIHENLEVVHKQHEAPSGKSAFTIILVQILALDIVLARLGDHGGWNGAAHCGDGDRDGRCSGRHARVLRQHRRVRQPASQHEDVGAQLSPAHRSGVGC